jgi:hypothetical protein
VVWLAPRALVDSVRPRRLADASARPLNFTVRFRRGRFRVHRSLLPGPPPSG